MNMKTRIDYLLKKYNTKYAKQTFIDDYGPPVYMAFSNDKVNYLFGSY